MKLKGSIKETSVKKRRKRAGNEQKYEEEKKRRKWTSIKTGEREEEKKMWMVLKRMNQRNRWIEGENKSSYTSLELFKPF